MPIQPYRKDLVYPELSYKIVGCAYEVFNEIGGGHKEKVYQKALAQCFQKNLIPFIEQLHFPIKFHSKSVEKGFFDFLAEQKIIVELKSRGFFTKGNYEQVLGYLNDSKLKLAILITFGQNDVRFKRVVNFNEIESS